ncbi:MAG: flagellar filament capping protein FliD [Deltaproteobacteria bacterium]|jgi:flagellar hook-associated protein 2|nr:flagellar filament capping protein FliD [Deltaproteobacteria bacterium]
MSSTTGVISGGIKWTGLASGTDFGAVVDKLVAIERRTITRQENWKAEWQEKITAISGLNTRLVSLKLDAQDKDLRSELLSRATSVSKEGVVSVINTSTASLGNYDVTVAEKVQDKLASKSFAGEILPAGGAATPAGDLEISVGNALSGTLTNLTPLVGVDNATPQAATAGFFRYGAGTSLTTLAEDINVTYGGVGVVASVLTDKTRGGVAYERLVLTSTEAGSQYRVNIDADPTNLALGESFINEPIYSTFLGSDVEVSLVPQKYEGPVNKTFTFVPENTGVLGTDSISIAWADTEGNSGKFTITSDDEEVDIMQGLKIKFSVGSGTGRFIKSESFSIDCQSPTFQKGQDSGVAQTSKVVHEGFVDQISPIQIGGSAEFSYSYKGEVHTVNVTDRMSLGILVENINSAADNPGVTATIVNDGTGTATAYHLVLTGNDTGAESTIEIVNPPVGKEINQANFQKNSYSTAREATNCMLKIDGFPSGADNWIQRKSNEVSDVIDGVVMTVTGVGETTLSVRNDSEAMRDKIVQLVNSINYCKTYILDYTKWGGSNLVTNMSDDGEISTTREVANGVMIGNYGFQISKTYLDGFMNNPLVPFSNDPSLTSKEKLEKREAYFEANGLVYTNLSDIGITSDPDNNGLYKVEQTRLLNAIVANPEAVIKLFTFSDEYTDKDSSGKDVVVSIKGVSLQIAEKMALLTSDTDIYDTAGNLVQKGKGIMVTLQENYESIIENINEKIAREERRIEAVKQRLTDKFNRLETSLQGLEAQQSKLDSAIESLSSS